MSPDQFTLLAVLAHPDDESFGIGGTLARYAAEGIKVVLLCGTDGAAGTVSAENLDGFDSIASLRSAELECASEKLGLDNVQFLGYRDSGMPGMEENDHPEALIMADTETLANQIGNIIASVNPDVIITHDPIGGYYHPDHIALNLATTRAFMDQLHAEAPGSSQNGRGPKKLYYHIFSRGWLKFLVRLLPLMGKDPEKWGRNHDIDLKELSRQNFPVDARINVSRQFAAKEAASHCHASQLEGGTRSGGVLTALLRLYDRSELYMRAYPESIKDGVESDLFEGLRTP